MANKPIFFDASGRRAAHISLLGWTAAVVSTIAGIAFLISIAIVPHLANVKLPGQMNAVPKAELERRAASPGLLKSAARLAGEARARRDRIARERLRRTEHAQRNNAAAAVLEPQTGRPLSIAFYPTWGDNTFASLQRALPHLDWVVPTWLTLRGTDMTLAADYDTHIANYIRDNKPGAAILPSLQNASGGKWDGPGLARLLARPEKRKALVSQIETFVGQNRLQGVVVDFEDLPVGARGNLRAFLAEMTAAFSPHGWVVVAATPVGDDTWPFAAMAKAVDYTMLMAYDEHWGNGAAGSVAGQPWYEDIIDKRMKLLDPARTIVAIGGYGYDWNGGDVDNVTFEEAVIAAHDSRADIDFDAATNNPHFSYVEDDNVKHDIWFLDGVTAYNQIHAADPYEPAGYALWRLGGEDPTVWHVMGKPYGSPAPEAMKRIPVIDDIDFEGRGEILSVAAEPTTGARTLEVDAKTQDIVDESYTKLPTTYVIKQFGGGDKKIALTFDDGPDPEWTPQILDILKEKKVPATFFVIGSNAESNPGLVQRLLADGHEVGSHTFTHPNLSVTPEEAVRLELNATQRLFEALTGRSLRLFRPPYLGDAEPTDYDEIVPVKIAQDMGYITVGEHVDPLDWALPGTDAIVKRTLDQVNGATPDVPRNIVLLHDAGGDRSQTVAALPVLIDRLRAEGYQFVPVSALIPLTTEEAMPHLPLTVSLLADRAVFMTLSTIGHVLYWCFFVAIWLGIARLLFLVGLSVWRRRVELRTPEPPLAPARFKVSVIVPAYNEENVIVSTVEGILTSAYDEMEVIVVDDGSKDGTLDVLKKTFGSDARVAILSIPNGGKANALNVGIAAATGEVIVALDADTQFEPETIARLVRWFDDATVGAVAGNAKVGNRINMITRWQALEYISAQNLERRALAALGTLTVVPGAVGAWRRTVLAELGGFRGDTLAEDQDLTIDLQRAGYRVLFDSSAVAWTEAPATFGGLSKQRFRWSYGTLQCLWKYRALTFRPRYGALGMIALPQVWLFQIALTALAPLADLLLVWQLLGQWIAYAQHGAEFRNADLKIVGIYYCVFIVVDLLAATFGFLMERREQWSLLWWLVFQRFGYRQLMYYVVVRSIFTALRGPFVGWGKLERMGTVLLGKDKRAA
ncbi:MAG: glycosyltransferase [Parvibaculum sp.]|uniref:polysaccharide deacetylase family protein n=1 Tax=Parvibaculum sp. TaxID=2024848 RepID=UPI0025D94CDB|nr:glycosyltransferase [Parvibaculum sp.]MCE9649401.1 glycosyltransferase [Parvibaculum sp.]